MRPVATAFKASRKVDEKPKVQPREVAQKAIKEIKAFRPKLMLYALAGGGHLDSDHRIGVTIYIHSQNSDDDSGAKTSRRRGADSRRNRRPSQPAPQSCTGLAATLPQPRQPARSDLRNASKPRRLSSQPGAPARATKCTEEGGTRSHPRTVGYRFDAAGAQVQLDGQTAMRAGSRRWR